MGSGLEAVVAGHICLDVLPAFAAARDLPGPGQLRQVGPAVLATGGAVSNTGLALDRLGIPTRLLGKVGDDAFGWIVRDLVASRNPDLAGGIIVAPGETTSYSIVLSIPGRDRSFLHCPGANETFCAGDLEPDSIAGARLFHFGYPPLMPRMYSAGGLELASLFRTVKSLGLTTSLDMAMVDPNSPAGSADWESILKSTLPHVDIFLPSVEELSLLVPSIARGLYRPDLPPTARSLRQVSEILLSWGPAMVGIKMGVHGLYLRTAESKRIAGLGAVDILPEKNWADREFWSPVFRVDQGRGTTGAGDSAIAGFLAAMLRGRTPEEVLSFACAVGACCIEAEDAGSGLKSWDQTWARIDSGWERIPMTFNEPGWHMDPRAMVYSGPAGR